MSEIVLWQADRQLPANRSPAASDLAAVLVSMDRHAGVYPRRMTADRTVNPVGRRYYRCFRRFTDMELGGTPVSTHSACSLSVTLSTMSGSSALTR